VSGYAEPYKMTALMGSSGAGKTTLLDVLAGRKTQGTITGGIYVNGEPKVDATFVTQMGYVEQFGVHSEASTVLESLHFSAALRLPRGTPKEAYGAIVEHTMQMLELGPIADKLVGKTGTAGALSFEEIKRLTIAVELVANPAVVFLDEPTSGLDARAAMIVVAGMKKIVESGRSIICTIHQPSTAVFDKFDSLLLMRRGGEVVFFGPLGPNSSNLKGYFLAQPGTPPLAPGMNPATWMLDVIGAGTGAAKATDFAHTYRESELAAANEMFIAEALAKQKGEQMMGMADDFSVEREAASVAADASEDSAASGGYQTSLGTQARWLMYRNLTSYWRSPSYSLIRWVITGLFMLVLGTIYWQISVSAVADVQSLVMVLAFVLQFLGIYNMFVVVPFMFNDKALFYREKASRMYSPWIFALSGGWTELPFVFIEVAIDVNIVYWAVGLNSTGWIFVYYWVTVLLYVILMTVVGQTFTYLLPNAAAAQAIAVMTSQIFSMFAGTTIPGAQIPKWLIWLRYFSPQAWATEGIITTQFQQDHTPFCNPSGQVVNGSCTAGVLTTVSAYVLGDPNLPPGDPGFGLYGGSGGFDYSRRWFDWLYIICFIALTRVGIVYASIRISYQKR